LPDFDVAKLNDALKAQHQYLVVKLHPYEMRFLANYASSYSNLAFLNNDYFSQHDCDLYEVLGVTDFLVTDFSSVYFDYLNLKRPVIFITNYLKQYEKVRGLLIGPYQKVVPGPCVKTQAELLAALRRPDHYQQKRQYWLDLTNQLQG
ncbi:CDP-glycerol--glycerophosphate glycerophosphotransferase, partial [Lactobacillus sp. XV13L]|nr:CDP-glycerol--glycerophosphate glycerophosphotransferase [Lactobacillus sp. XV13L]